MAAVGADYESAAHLQVAIWIPGSKADYLPRSSTRSVTCERICNANVEY
jgi:hypothetical protein